MEEWSSWELCLAQRCVLCREYLTGFDEVKAYRGVHQPWHRNGQVHVTCETFIEPPVYQVCSARVLHKYSNTSCPLLQKQQTTQRSSSSSQMYTLYCTICFHQQCVFCTQPAVSPQALRCLIHKKSLLSHLSQSLLKRVLSFVGAAVVADVVVSELHGAD